MTNAFVNLRHFAATVEYGATSRDELCPWCTGGSDREHSFAITRTSEALALYKCHRASCGRSGRIAVWGFRLDGAVPGPSTEARKSFTPRLYTSDTRELGEGWYSELLELYELQPGDVSRLGWREETGTGSLVCPVLSSLGVVRGYEVRRSKVQNPGTYSQPKTKSYRFLEQPWMGWYRTPNSSGRTVLVEDAISAAKISRHFQAVCLHGSHVNIDMLLEILHVIGNEDLVLALDEDATDKALKFAAEWRFLAPNFRTVPLSKDLKYSTDIQIQEICKHA